MPSEREKRKPQKILTLIDVNRIILQIILCTLKLQSVECSEYQPMRINLVQLRLSVEAKVKFFGRKFKYFIYE